MHVQRVERDPDERSQIRERAVRLPRAMGARAAVRTVVCHWDDCEERERGEEREGAEAQAHVERDAEAHRVEGAEGDAAGLAARRPAKRRRQRQRRVEPPLSVMRHEGVRIRICDCEFRRLQVETPSSEGALQLARFRVAHSICTAAVALGASEAARADAGECGWQKLRRQ
eukprot:1210826-Pleurochrysis_carterae.AAC.4